MNPAAPSTYRQVADGRLVDRANRDAMARVLNPRVLVSFVAFGILSGIGASLYSYAAHLPYYLGRVLLIGVVWGLAWILLVTVLVVVVAPLAKAVNRRLIADMFAAGSVTEVELARDVLAIRRPAGTRSVRYRKIARVRKRGSYLRVEMRGRLMAELLPAGMLPEDAIAFIRARARGVWPRTTPLGSERPDRELVVPAGWATHVATVTIRAALLKRRFWVRFTPVLLMSVLLGLVAGPGWLLLAPALALLGGVLTFAMTRRALAAALPAGSVASTEFLEDRFISRNAGGTREILFDDIRSLDVHRDVVLLRMRSEPRPLAIARELIPDEQLEELPH